MTHEELRHKVLAANLRLAREGLAPLTWGNVSGVDREAGVLVIKPSGVPYDKLRAEDLPVVALDDARVLDGKRRPSSDTATHRELYRAFPNVGGIVHTHSPFATAWAQACRPLPCLGTTHADAFHGPVPVARPLTPGEIEDAYEAHTGKVIVERFRDGGLDPQHMPAVLLPWHGPFTWGMDADQAVTHAVTLEACARMACHTAAIDPAAKPLPDVLLAKHFRRKHGATAYYGQPEDRPPARPEET